MLQKINIQPGFNKQVTATGGEGQWVGGDYVRFRYGSPEKIGDLHHQLTVQKVQEITEWIYYLMVLK